MMKFYSCELDKKIANALKAYLIEKGFYFEPSACYNLIHFEVKCTAADLDTINAFIDTLDEGR